ncbi:MAG: hypothetical protein EOQ39_22335 [Mesorhizobium sp.]|uniref:hypothetical protein n=1 Tax=Mesorhizobium sp. TaxID=1871066 RepID=UPI000FE46C1C|nr:hypothetical protein [Mesorhizobium sp.]RWB05482.1 MAG: hypothetical protein EOQ37_14575 [Mesorhizobium sp.]RWB12547.1 MAG: hypothetical protein EOQ39_22335 [Mesorhizobium sp.]
MWIELTLDGGLMVFVNMDNVTDFSGLDGELTVIRTTTTEGDGSRKIRVAEKPYQIMNMIVEEQRRRGG